MPARRRPTAAKATCGACSRATTSSEATDTGKIEKRLTDTPGYDAEATVNWKTEQDRLHRMASGDLDLWTMKPDGSAKKQITKTAGLRRRRRVLARRQEAGVARPAIRRTTPR